MNDLSGFTSISPFEQFDIGVGHMLLGLILITDKPEAAILVKDYDSYIFKHYSKPAIELRIGLIKIGNVQMVPVMLMVSKDFDMLYELTYNYNIEESREILNCLCEQDYISIIFYNQNNDNVRNIIIYNSIKNELLEIKMRIQNRCWTMDDFDKARLCLFKEFKTPADLWNRIEKQNIYKKGAR